MRKRIIVAVAAALASVLALVVLNVNFLVRRNKELLVGRAEQALGRKISVDQIEVTFWPVGARLVNIVLADDPAFSREDFLRAKAVRVELRLLPLFIGEFRPKKLDLESPIITVVRDVQRPIQLRDALPREKTGARNAGNGKKLRDEQQDSRLFWVPSFNISDGTLRFRDLTDGGELTRNPDRFENN